MPEILPHNDPAADKEQEVMSAQSGMGKAVLAVALSGIWVNLCEFARNQLLLLSQWQAHYRGMGLVFPAQPMNALLWVVWAFLLAGTVFALSRRFGLWGATFLAWVMAFVMMWVVIWNLSVLPIGILPTAVPFSFVEALGAALICRKLAKPAAP